jgi:glutathione S-transferase
MHITLYFTPGTRAIRPRWLLEELEVKYDLEIIDLFGGEGQKPQYRAVHPLGQVPAMRINGQLMLESGAMCHWLADHYAGVGLAPPHGDPTRIPYEQWMAYAPGSLEPPGFYALLHSRILPEDRRIPAIVPSLMKRYARAVAVVAEALAEKAYLLGDRFSAADIMVGSTLMWLPDVLADHPNLGAYVDRLRQRPAYRRATVTD